MKSTIKSLLVLIMTSLFFMFMGGCRAIQGIEVESNDTAVNGSGGNAGSKPYFYVPFRSGEYWQLTHGYNLDTSDDYNEEGELEESHVDYGGTYSDDSYALDFGQSGCEAYGKPVTAVADGEVYQVQEDDGDDKGYGNTVIVRHENGYYSRYAHLSAIMVEEDEEVDEWSYIGKVGNTGYVVGSSCEKYEGTHLHLGVYNGGDGVKPEPLSGTSDLKVECWYNREGNEACSGESYADYNEEDVSTEIGINYVDVSPDSGTAGETQFVWISVVESEEEPEATLRIYNPSDNYAYPFEMWTYSEESPWVFIYQKTLNSALTYEYWVEAQNGDDKDISDVYEVTVENASSSHLEIESIDADPDSGIAGETSFNFNVDVESSSKPEITLYIVSPYDAYSYPFEMTVNSTGETTWEGDYEKEYFSNVGIFVYWAVASNGNTSATSEVKYVVINNNYDDDAEGGGNSGQTEEDEDQQEEDDTNAGNNEEETSDTQDTEEEAEEDVEEDHEEEDTTCHHEDEEESSSEEDAPCTLNVPGDFSSIQEAIDASGSGEVICVESGTYYENISLDGVNLTLRSSDGAEATIIDGSGSSSAVSITDGADVTIDGFSIRNGYSGLGGGIYINNASPLIKHCKISDNNMYGIGVWNGAVPEIENSVIVENSYRAVYVTNSAAVYITNSVLSNNGSDGIAAYTSSTISMTNSIVSGNGGYGVVGYDSSITVNLGYNDVYGNSSGNYYGTASASSTEFSSDPSFAETDWYTLAGASVCEDAGNPSSSYNDADGSRNDVGAYGGPLGSW